MADNIDTRITPALHPTNVESLDGYTEETAQVLGPTIAAFEEAYRGLQSIHDAKAAAAKNPTLNDAARLIQVDDFAQRRLTKINSTFDAELRRLDKAVASLEADLSQPVTARAAHPIASEIRGHIKSLPTGERMKVIQQAIDSGDVDVATAVLGAPAMLSGINPDMQKTLLRFWHVKQSPKKAARLKVMEGAKALIEQRGGLAQTEVLRAVGYMTDPKTKRKIYAKELREAKNASEQPFKSVA